MGIYFCCLHFLFDSANKFMGRRDVWQDFLLQSRKVNRQYNIYNLLHLWLMNHHGMLVNCMLETMPIWHEFLQYLNYCTQQWVLDYSFQHSWSNKGLPVPLCQLCSMCYLVIFVALCMWSPSTFLLTMLFSKSPKTPKTQTNFILDIRSRVND